MTTTNTKIVCQKCKKKEVKYEHDQCKACRDAAWRHHCIGEALYGGGGRNP
jgi:hypothetical protein